MDFEKLDFKDVIKKKKYTNKSDIVYDQMQKDLIVTKWQKSAVRSAIKAALIEKKLMKLLSDPKLTNKDLARILRECVTFEPVQKFLSLRDSKD
ncbi:hypothetical protein SteCoe_14759 [Stentor coeruleus]|uniref:Uncharacterized protein n=1 Tax=Stentor coeruleus TaxID=5963 RepID=A0A1R2C599_9CILI|nr:hypothetical protein SteCoe_14759 [Stentor coeruleus]